MKIIGHRGAAGLALENTLPSLELARLLGVDAVEFDVRLTRDRHFVLCHDNYLDRISTSDYRLSDFSLAELQAIILNDEQSRIPTLEEAMRVVGDTPVIIELKESGCAKELLKALKKFPGANITIASFHHQEAAEVKRLRPDIKVYLAERTRPIEIIQLAHDAKADGLDLNFWLLNPLTYFLAKRSKLELMVYTVNSRILARFINLLYPDVAICTNHPEWFIKHPWLRLRSSSRLRAPKSTVPVRSKQTGRK
jgi:glycerophosphoryl diester phosphodiesterase